MTDPADERIDRLAGWIPCARGITRAADAVQQLADDADDDGWDGNP